MTHGQLRAVSHPYYQAVNTIFAENGFDKYAEEVCAKFYAAKIGRPGLAPGIYFRPLLLGHFEGIDSERGIAWRAADSLSLRDFLGIPASKPTPDHSTISKDRKRIDLEAHQSISVVCDQVLPDRHRVAAALQPSLHDRGVRLARTG